MGIPVIAMRYRNVIVAGLIAGIGGAYFTIGSVGSFGKDMTSGEGYIALAAMIFGRYTPFGAIAAALLFGFTTQLQSILSTLNTPIQSNLLLMTPYIVTIVVLAGLVGKVRGPGPRASPTSRRKFRAERSGARFACGFGGRRWRVRCCRGGGSGSIVWQEFASAIAWRIWASGVWDRGTRILRGARMFRSFGWRPGRRVGADERWM